MMKNKNGFAVSYNPQTAVDSETHLIRDFEMTSQVTDHGMLVPTMKGIRAVESGAPGKGDPCLGEVQGMDRNIGLSLAAASWKKPSAIH